MSMDLFLVSKKSELTTEKVKKALDEIEVENPEIKIEYYHDPQKPNKISCRFGYFVEDGHHAFVDYDPDDEYNPFLESNSSITINGYGDDAMYLIDTMVLLFKKLPNLILIEPQEGKEYDSIQKFELALYDDDHFRLPNGRLNPHYLE